ncbi:MAG: DegT/DnrJ/EryC1/StrS family aminotransferase [Nostoc sp.]|uniref:DegT/DnrJ/EryC1/StrS aminotransferase family protein n=1 Tax=Nostoc sp. TaxID=1180 RepID=UPI002FF3E0F1
MVITTEKPALLGGSKVFPEPLPRYISISSQETEAAIQVLKSGILSDYIGAAGLYFMGGKQVRTLEEQWAKYFNVRHALSVNSATSGLHAAVIAAGVNFGDEVIVPPQTMSATATAVVIANGTPVFVDQEETNCCIDPEAVERAIRPRTKAIIAVNLFGGPAQLLRLRELADRHGLILIEDNAQAPGGQHQGRWLGTIGHLGVFSLNCHKTIQCGEGGIVVTNDDHLARRVALVRNHGENAIEAENWYEDADIVGYNYRLTELQAAIAQVQLQRLEELTQPRLKIAEALDQGLSEFKSLRTAKVGSGDRHVYYTYPIWIDPQQAGLSRDRFVEALQAEGCPVTGRYVRPLYRLPLFKKLQQQGKTIVSHPTGVCPIAEKTYSETLLSTTLIQIPRAIDLVDRFIASVAKVLAHAEELSQGKDE